MTACLGTAERTPEMLEKSDCRNGSMTIATPFFFPEMLKNQLSKVGSERSDRSRPKIADLDRLTALVRADHGS